MKIQISFLRNFLRTGFLGILLLHSCSMKPDMTFETVQKGNDLNRIPEVSLDVFFQSWIKNRRDVKIDVNVRKLFEDERFVYFGKNEFGIFTSRSHFFKVEKEILQKEFPGYEDVFVSELRNYFWSQALPQEDRDVWVNVQRKDDRCGLTYQFILKDKKIILTASWEVKDCPDLAILRSKTYRLIYDPLAKRYE
ncbi:hypothetical protein EHR10_16360 [Leptospira yasudae]|nr:hypothetical protein EHR10_16360 [Leptospira yasudae]